MTILKLYLAFSIVVALATYIGLKAVEWGK